MAGTSRFHDKLHRANHHSAVSPGLPDSSYDPIASKEHPFRGDFVLSGALSAQNDVTLGGVLSARGDGTTESFVARKSLTVNEGSSLLGPIYTNSLGSYVTTKNFPVTTSNGPATLTFNYLGGIYVNGSPPKLIVGAKGYDAGLLSVTNIDAVSANLETAIVTDKLGIGTTNPQHELHVVGDVIIYGTLTANGNSYFQNTLFTTTSSLSIVNTGTGAGLTVSQEGNQPIVAFFDHESSISLWADGHADRPGWIGVKTSEPNVELTVNGSISSSSVIYSSSSDSNQWQSTYNTTTANSANWGSVYSSIGANSGTWSSNYTTTNANSAKWHSNYTSTNSTSALWSANYTTTNTRSAFWDSNYSTVLANSGSWSSGGQSNTTLATNSARWNSNYTTTNTKSAFWDSNYSTVLANSASWSAGGGSSGAVFSTVNALSANWNNSYNTLTSNSASWSSVYNTTTTNSASWNSGGAVNATVASNSAKWESNYTTTSTNSGNWNSSYVTLLANSGTWDSAAGALVDIDLDYLADVSITSNTLADGQVLVYDIGTQQWENSSLVLSAIVQGSSLWAASYSTTNANSASWVDTTTTVQNNSANWDTSYTAVITNSAIWNTNSLSGSTDVIITSPVNNALLQYDAAQSKWVDGDTLITTGTLTAGSIDLTTAEISTYETELSANGDFLLLRINGVVRKLRLWD